VLPVSHHVAFLDTETTGLDPVLHRVWEVGLIVGGEEYHWFVDQTDDSPIDPIAADISGFHERYDSEAATPAWAVASQIHALIDGHTIVGANPMFDLVRITPWWQELGWEVPWHYRPICIESVLYGSYRGWEGIGQWNGEPIDVPWRASELYERVTGMVAPEEGLHTALGDARYVKALWDRAHR
jgi:hypothetical protein